METREEEGKTSDKARDDEREACVMCGACTILDKGCLLIVSPEED